jgi:tetratricopeptide (TPR) repeat protein
MDATTQNAEDHLRAAEQALTQGCAGTGLQEARAALHTQPENGRAHALVALAYALMGEAEDAREALARATNLAPRDSRVRYTGFLALVRLGEREAARAQMTYFSQLEPDNVRARALLTQLGGAVMGLPPLPAPPTTAVWYDGGGHATTDSSEYSALTEDENREPPPGPDVVDCPDCQKRTWKGWVCKHCGAPLPRPV